MAAGYQAALARYEGDGAMAEKKSKEDRQKGGG
jgi:hypothetical protein